MPRRVAIAMSGGVDSSVAAALIARQGEPVFGLMLRLWSDPRLGPNRCCAPDDVERARQTAGMLDIPFYVVDAQDAFRAEVVEPFLDGYAQGLTPNPCVLCNRTIRWQVLLQHAQSLGATNLATGHYARLHHRNDGWQLWRAADAAKDQSYVLSVLGQAQLAASMFPLGDLLKEDVRAWAHALKLPASNRPESQDLCFLGGQDYRKFLHTYGRAMMPGEIVDTQGRVLGVHSGLHNYTIGQRRGIGISGPKPLYVVEKRPGTHQVVVGERSSLGRTSFRLRSIHWIEGRPPSQADSLTVQVRYRAPGVPARIEGEAHSAIVVQLTEPLPDIAPGQLAVFYDGDRCLGSGDILE